MDQQVQRNRDPRDCRQPDELGIAQESGRAMMVGMEEG